MAQWEDATTYSKGGDKTPTAWSIRFGNIKLSVTSDHIYYRGKWVARCAPFFDTKQLNVDNEQDAKSEAVELLSAHLNRAINELELFLEHSEVC